MQSNIKFLLAIVIVLLVASYFVLNNRPNDAEKSQQMLIPELQDLINQVDGISIKKNDQLVTLERTDKMWRLLEMDGFIADTNKVAALLLDLRKLSLKQQKTSNPENYGTLSLAESGDNAATVVVLKSQGQVIADVSIGKRAPRSQGIYVRKNTEAQSWVSEGELSIKTTASDWLLNTIIDIGPELIRSVRYEPRDAEAFVINKLTPEDQSFGLDNVPESMKVSSQTDVDAAAGGLQKVTIESARKKIEIAEQDRVTRVTYELFSGATFAVDLIQTGEEKLVEVTVANDNNDAVLASELERWLFVLPAYKFDALNKRLSDFVEPQTTSATSESGEE